jgi:hypothetical protein
VIGVLTSFCRKGKQYDTTDRGYRRYVRFWDAVYPLRKAVFRDRRFALKAARKAGIVS